MDDAVHGGLVPADRGGTGSMAKSAVETAARNAAESAAKNAAESAANRAEGPRGPGRPGSVAMARTPAGVRRTSPEPHEGRVALVSGGNRGLGLQVVHRLAEIDMRVVLASRSLDNGHAAVEMLGGLASRIAVRQLDITDAASVSRLAFWLQRRLGRCDVLVNNAAVLLDDEQASHDVDLEVVRRTLETNVLGTWRLTQAIVPLMLNHGYGRIVNISSGLGRFAAMRRGLPAYRVSKCAVNALTRILADELTNDGILVNACCPGPAHIELNDDDLTRLSASPETPVWLATLPDDGPTGCFFRSRAPINW